MSLIIAYKELYLTDSPDFKEYLWMFECLTGYGLGCSTVSVFTRIGGGIFNKAADISSDIVGKIITGLDEDSPLNPGMIADTVGDNVGGVAGTCTDFFGCLSEALCATLILCGTSSEMVKNSNAFYFFPIIVIICGCILSIFVTVLV